MIRHVISFITWRCGLGCPYCGYYLQPDGKSVKYRPAPVVSQVEREISPQEWIDLLKSLAPATYDFCGGEPTRYEGLETVLAALPAWAMTSNTTLPLKRLKGFPLEKCVSWTASCHYNAPPEAYARFWANIRYLKGRGINVSSTLVAMPDNVDEVIGRADELVTYGIHAQIHPYYDEPSFTWNDHPEAWEKLKQSKYVCYDEQLKSFTGIRGQNKTCRAGSDYICLSPDGKIYRCLWHILSGQQPLTAPDNLIYYCSLNCYLPCDWVYALKRKF
jgi:MoaA/NifB/PqqE/SkfB family radical SAM enzyme